MKARRLLARQLAWGVAVVWAVMTVAWAIIAFMPDPNTPLLMFGCTMGGGSYAECQVMVDSYQQTRGFAGSLVVRYLEWMTDFATLQWGYSFQFGRPVTEVITDRAPLTILYVVPAVLLSVVTGVTLGTYAAVRPGSLADRVASGFAYLGASQPLFWLCELALFLVLSDPSILQLYVEDLGLFHPRNLVALLVPCGLLALNLVPIQLRYARTEAGNYRNEEFVKTARAKGASRLRIAVHVFRNAWLPMYSLFFTELLGTLFLGAVVVEAVLDLPGVASAMYNGFLDRDPGLTMVALFVAVLVGVVGRILQDLVAHAYNPQISDAGAR